MHLLNILCFLVGKRSSDTRNKNQKSIWDCGCDVWTEWQGQCSQQCGGCGKRQRKRVCIKVRTEYYDINLTYQLVFFCLRMSDIWFGGRTNYSPFQDETCQTIEKRPCNFDACPEGTNFLLNNGEVHLLWRGCCIGEHFDEHFSVWSLNFIGQIEVTLDLLINLWSLSGLFRQGDTCAALEANSNPLLSIISELLKTNDAYGPQGSEPPLEGAAIRTRKRL